MKDSFYEKCKDFIEDFSTPLDYEDIKQRLTEITSSNYQLHNIPISPEIYFEDLNAFGCYGKVSKNGQITFNKKRLETLIALKIDCFSDNHLQRIWDFYKNYDKDAKHNIYEEYVYEFMQKYIKLGAERYFAQMESYKTIKFDLLETILHEKF